MGKRVSSEAQDLKSLSVVTFFSLPEKMIYKTSQLVIKRAAVLIQERSNLLVYGNC